MSIIKKHSYYCNYIVFIIKIILFLITKSYIFIISSIYNLCIGIIKHNILSNKNDNVFIGILVIIASLSFMSYSIYIIIFKIISNYNLYIGITIATITFYDIGYALYGIIKYKNNKNLMLVNLATSLISLQLTQTALLSFTMNGIDNSLYNGIIGIIVSFISLIIGIYILIKNE